MEIDERSFIVNDYTHFSEFKINDCWKVLIRWLLFFAGVEGEKRKFASFFTIHEIGEKG
jgi:hypothetical protein